MKNPKEIIVSVRAFRREDRYEVDFDIEERVEPELYVEAEVTDAGVCWGFRGTVPHGDRGTIPELVAAVQGVFEFEHSLARSDARTADAAADILALICSESATDNPDWLDALAAKWGPLAESERLDHGDSDTLRERVAARFPSVTLQAPIAKES